MAEAHSNEIEALLAQRYPGVQIQKKSVVQSLWSGYGQILRLHLGPKGISAPNTVVVKLVKPPQGDSGISHERKCNSYVVEQFFYETCAARLDPQHCRVPTLLCSGQRQQSGETLFVLEDLDAQEAGFGGRRHSLSLKDAQACVVWLAHFHRTFLNTKGKSTPEGLWEQGCYWHLATRPDEHASMDRRDPLKEAATGVDQLLRNAKHHTLLHGDAKLANFCWRESSGGGTGKKAAASEDGPEVAAVDFQYCGWGVGVLDVAYCLGSFPGIDNLARDSAPLLDLYFKTLDAGPEVEAEWRKLYCVAVADFERFLAGWAGSSYKRNGYLGDMVNEALALAADNP